MADFLEKSFQTFIGALELEVKTLKNITNIRLLETSNGEYPADVIGKALATYCC